MREKGFILSPFGKLRAGKADGFTLVELLVAMAVSSVILTGAVLSVYNVLITTGRGSSQAVALTDLNRAAYAIKNDLLMTQYTDLSSTPQSSAELTWYDYTSSFGSEFQTSHSASYSLSGKNLIRSYDGTESIVGRNITSLSFTQSGKAVTVVISSSNTTASSGTETLRFTVHLRSEEAQ